MNDFISAFEETLDLAPGSVTPGTAYRDLPEWDSLAQLAVMTIIEDIYKKVVDPALIRNSKTVGELVAAVQAA